MINAEFIRQFDCLDLFSRGREDMPIHGQINSHLCYYKPTDSFNDTKEKRKEIICE